MSFNTKNPEYFFQATLRMSKIIDPLLLTTKLEEEEVRNPKAVLKVKALIAWVLIRIMFVFIRMSLIHEKLEWKSVSREAILYSKETQS